jgi:hypothetical protein
MIYLLLTLQNIYEIKIKHEAHKWHTHSTSASKQILGLLEATVHKSRATEFGTVPPNISGTSSTEHASCHTSGTYSFEVAATFSGNVWNPDVNTSATTA